MVIMPTLYRFCGYGDKKFNPILGLRGYVKVGLISSYARLKGFA